MYYRIADLQPRRNYEVPEDYQTTMSEKAALEFLNHETFMIMCNTTCVQFSSIKELLEKAEDLMSQDEFTEQDKTKLIETLKNAIQALHIADRLTSAHSRKTEVKKAEIERKIPDLTWNTQIYLSFIIFSLSDKCRYLLTALEKNSGDPAIIFKPFACTQNQETQEVHYQNPSLAKVATEMGRLTIGASTPTDQLMMDMLFKGKLFSADDIVHLPEYIWSLFLNNYDAAQLVHMIQENPAQIREFIVQLNDGVFRKPASAELEDMQKKYDYRYPFSNLFTLPEKHPESCATAAKILSRMADVIAPSVPKSLFFKPRDPQQEIQVAAKREDSGAQSISSGDKTATRLGTYPSR